ncbi:MAG: hypothetical protein QM765_31750 [Myxococcales bacterium]
MRRFLTLLGLWFGLIVVFIVLYTVGGQRASALTELMPYLVVPIFLVVFAYNLVRARKTNALSMASVARLNEGRYVEALAGFEQVARRAPKSPVALHNLGVAQLGLWQVAEAEQSFARAVKRSRFYFDLRNIAQPNHALCAALLGKVPEANASLLACEKLKVADSPQAILCRAVLAARAGKLEDARDQLARPELRMLAGSSRGLAEVLSAWLASQLAGEARRVDVVSMLGEAGVDRIKPVWPELHDFVVRASAAA